MRIAGQLLLPDPEGGVRLAPGVVRVDAGRVAAVEPLDEGARFDLGGPGVLVTPGLIDAHMHLPQFDSAGVFGLTLLEWLDRVIFPAEVRWADAGYAGNMSLRVARTLLGVGTTAVAAYATVHHAGAQAAIDALSEAGLRGVVGQVLMDRRAPAELVRPAATLLAEAARVKDRPGVTHAITPRFAISCTDELLRGAGELARRTGRIVQTHLAETRPECALVGELFDGLGYVEVYRRAGLLTPGALLGHSIYLSQAEREVLRAHGCVAAHCPTANTFLQSGTFDRDATLHAGVPVALGSDLAGGGERSMIRVARAMIDASIAASWARPGAKVLTPAQAWRQITIDNARALRLDDAGRIAPGASADLLLIRPDPAWLKSPDPLGYVLFGWDDRWLEQVYTAGVRRYSAPAGGAGASTSR
jgi:guanine deaminase